MELGEIVLVILVVLAAGCACLLWFGFLIDRIILLVIAFVNVLRKMLPGSQTRSVSAPPLQARMQERDVASLHVRQSLVGSSLRRTLGILALIGVIVATLFLRTR
jgi:hypothetical protein